MKKQTTVKSLEVPVLLGYNFLNKNKFKISVVAGPQFSFDMGSGSGIHIITPGAITACRRNQKPCIRFAQALQQLPCSIMPASAWAFVTTISPISSKPLSTSRLFFDKMATPSLTFTRCLEDF